VMTVGVNIYVHVQQKYTSKAVVLTDKGCTTS